MKKSLESHCINIEDVKMLIKECLKGRAHVYSRLRFRINILEKVIGFESLFDFLSKYDFISYINYKLLEKLSKLVKDDNEINRLFLEYGEEYDKALNAASFKDMMPLFEKHSDLSPTAPVDLPCISFRLERPWLVNSFYNWVLTFGQFSWSCDAYLKQLRENCIIVTYAILPCVLDDALRDLKNLVILKKLKDDEVTIYELPQEEKSELDNALYVLIMLFILSESQLGSTTKKVLISVCDLCAICAHIVFVYIHIDYTLISFIIKTS